LDHRAPAGVGGVRLISMERARYAPPQHAEETR
jgi:hypothetical protein